VAVNKTFYIHLLSMFKVLSEHILLIHPARTIRNCEPRRLQEGERKKQKLFKCSGTKAFIDDPLKGEYHRQI
jgi:hypothetical protein